MHQNFTDRARKVMLLANDEAKGFNHEYIGTEHLLLGLIKEGSGVAANLLKILNVDYEVIRHKVENAVQRGTAIAKTKHLPQTPRTKKVIEYSLEESRTLGHNYVGTEHLRLGLAREQEGVAAQVLASLGLTLDNIRNEVLMLLGHVRESESVCQVPTSSQLDTEAAAAAARTIQELDHYIEQIHCQKDDAIKASRFEEAAELLDKTIKLTRLHEDILNRRWPAGPFPPFV